MAKSKIPSALNYWNGWAIARSSDGGYRTLLVLGDAKGETIREKDHVNHVRRIASGDVDYILKLIEESSLNLDDKTLKDWLPTWQRRWSEQARVGNEEARKKLNKLHNALKGGQKGKTPIHDLKQIIGRDIELFRYILELRETSKDSLEKIIRRLAPREKYDRAQEIYKAYKNLLDKCLPVLGSLENFFVLLEVCRENIDKPGRIVFRQEMGFAFLKGEAQSDRLLTYTF